MSTTVDELNEILSEELDDIFENKERDLRPWARKEWKENREETVGEVCEWCGEDEAPLHIHHTGSGPNWSKEWIQSTDTAFGESESFSTKLVSEREECPECGLRDYYSRKTKEPTYRCNNCSEEFAEPRIVQEELVTSPEYTTKQYVLQGYYTEKLNWLRDNRDAARTVFLERFDEIMKAYIEMNEDSVVTICQSCHFQHEQTSNRRCKNCKENWHKYNKEMCWDCLVEEKGLVECDCGDGWYQESKYDSCSSCRD